MRFKGTLILLVICLALGAFVYFYEIKGGEEREKATQAEKQLWELEDKDIRQIDFIFPDRQITAERRGEEEWFLTDPRQLEADSDELNRLVSSAAKMERESTVEPNAEDLAIFGLDPSQSSLRLTTSAGEEHTVIFGNNNPTGSSAYAVLPGQKDGAYPLVRVPLHGRGNGGGIEEHRGGERRHVFRRFLSNIG